VILADQMPPLAVVAAIGVFVGLAVFALFLFRGYERLARGALRRSYAQLAIHDAPRSGDVVLTYHTYHGFVAWFTQATHQVALPPRDARILLGRLLRFNLTWGLLTWGVVFIPPLAILNYFQQRRSIALQGAAGGILALANRPGDAPSTAPAVAALPIDESVNSSSSFRRFVGWIATGLCAVFAVSTVVCLATGKFEAAIGGVLVTALLGWVARDWLWAGPRT
jgi:hypothetical protein